MTRKNKIVTVLVCFILSTSCFAKELTSFMDINFGTSKEKSISIMKKNGWGLESNNDSILYFHKDDAFFMGVIINSIMLTFSNNLLTAGSYIIELDQDNMQDVFKVHKNLQQIYEVQNIEKEELNGMASIIGYTSSGNRIITTLAPGLCMFTFGINKEGKIGVNSTKEEKKRTNYEYISFDTNGDYELETHFFLNNEIASWNSMRSYEQKSKSDYLDWNDSYFAIIKKYDFTPYDDGYKYLKQFSLTEKLIPGDSVVLKQYGVGRLCIINLFCFKVVNGKIDYTSCYKIDLTEKPKLSK